MIRPKRSNATRGGLERLPTRKPLQLSTVTGSSEGAPRSSEEQDLASLANNACQAAAALAYSSPGGESPFFADDDAAVPERRVFDSEFPRKVDASISLPRTTRAAAILNWLSQRFLFWVM